MQALNQAVKDFMSIFKNDLQQAAIRSKEVIILGSDLNCNFWQNETILRWNLNSLRAC